MTLAPPQANADKELDSPPKRDEDPDGFKLLGSTDPLEQAAKVLQPLTTVATDSIDIWITSYDVAIRRSEYDYFYPLSLILTVPETKKNSYKPLGR